MSEYVKTVSQTFAGSLQLQRIANPSNSRQILMSSWRQTVALMLASCKWLTVPQWRPLLLFCQIAIEHLKNKLNEAVK